MRIALFLESPPESGGGFVQALSTVESLLRLREKQHEVIVFTPLERTRQWLLGYGIESVVFKRLGLRLIDRWSSTVVGCAVLRRLRRLGFRRLGRHLDALLDDYAIDLVVLAECAEAALRISDHHYVVTHWDADHRDYLEFPEKYADRNFERREASYGTTMIRALAVIALSPSAARRIADLYRVDPHRIVVLPLLPSLAVRRHAAGLGPVTVDMVRRKYDLPDQYLFYPAYFSYHKNHLYILDGLVELERRHGIVMHAVFCGGGDPGDRIVIERQTQSLGLTSRIHFLGVVPDEDIPPLYEAALCMVMPTYCGPTNLPPLEAVTLGCPVIYSDLPGWREHMGEAALYCDLANPSSLAGLVASLTRDPALVDRLRKSGKVLAEEIAQVDYVNLLSPVLEKYAYMRRRWAWPEETKK